MAAGEPAWTAPLHEAHAAPAAVARRLRARGTAVIGIVGRAAPRELVSAAGMHPLRIAPRRLSAAAPGAVRLPPGLEAELAPGMLTLVSAFTAGELDWIDGLLIGRDDEAHAKLFQVLRELRRLGLAPERPPVAFFDLARLPGRPSARYNRVRLRELADLLAAWSGRDPAELEVSAAVAGAALTARALARVDDLRRDGIVRGSDALLAALAAEILPGAELRAALARLPEGGDAPGPRPRVFLTGSGIDDPAPYRVLERAGAHLVGEDHEFADDGRSPAAPTPDPIDGIADRLHLGPHGAARSGLGERVAAAGRRVRDASAEIVLCLRHPGDDAPGWELPALRESLAPVPVAAVRLVPGAEGESELRDVLEQARETAGV